MNKLHIDLYVKPLLLLSMFFGIDLSICAESVTAIYDGSTGFKGNTITTTDLSISWERSESTIYCESTEMCLYVLDTYVQGEHHQTYLTTRYNGLNTDIPYVYSVSFRAKRYVNDPIVSPILLQYFDSKTSTWNPLSCTPDLSSLNSSDWENFSATLPNAPVSARIRFYSATGGYLVLLDDLTITYDPDYVAPSPEPTPDPCANCFQVTF